MKYKLQKQYRLKDWDYSADGCCFVTICTKYRRYLLGNIKNEKIKLSEMGKIVEKHWLEIPKHFTNVRLDEYQVMPNHLHGILLVERESDENLINQIPTKMKSGIKNNPMELKKLTLGKIIRWYKGRSAYEIRRNMIYHVRNEVQIWQSRFYDRVIRNDEELNKIREYIQYNVLKWNLDKNNNENLLM